jgi:hypothetical protein
MEMPALLGAALRHAGACWLVEGWRERGDDARAAVADECGADAEGADAHSVRAWLALLPLPLDAFLAHTRTAAAAACVLRLAARAPPVLGEAASLDVVQRVLLRRRSAAFPLSLAQTRALLAGDDVEPPAAETFAYAAAARALALALRVDAGGDVACGSDVLAVAQRLTVSCMRSLWMLAAVRSASATARATGDATQPDADAGAAAGADADADAGDAAAAYDDMLAAVSRWRSVVARATAAVAALSEAARALERDESAAFGGALQRQQLQRRRLAIEQRLRDDVGKLARVAVAARDLVLRALRARTTTSSTVVGDFLQRAARSAGAARLVGEPLPAVARGDEPLPAHALAPSCVDWWSPRAPA